MGIHICNLSKVELVKKLSILITAIKAKEDSRFSFKADWDEDGMRIVIGIEDYETTNKIY